MILQNHTNQDFIDIVDEALLYVSKLEIAFFTKRKELKSLTNLEQINNFNTTI